MSDGGEVPVAEGSKELPEGSSSAAATVGSPGAALARAGGHQLCMLLIGEQQFASHWLIPGRSITIGRSPECDALLNDGTLDPFHARLHVGEILRIEDLGSSSGTFVRGERIAPNTPTAFSAWDLISLGTVSLLIQKRTAEPERRIHTHGYFETRLEEECIRAERYHSEFALVRIQVDGAAPQKAIEEALASVFRMVDVVGYYGPRAYEALLPNTVPEGVPRLIERLSEALGNALGSSPGAAQVHARIGSACYPRDGRTADALVAHARIPEEPSAGASPATPLPPRAQTDARGAASTLRNLDQLVRRIANSTISVLILGETGVGKERMAEKIHRLSPRASKPFLRLNCAALSESLLETELFGHERGAFTGAVQMKPGLLETADGGTIFLDEIGDLPLTIQVKLLRVLEERSVMRVGALKARSIDVRFVSATNRDLEAEVSRGRYREDLFFRLNGVSLVIPPLRERVEEIPELVGLFVSEAYRAMGRTAVPGVSPDAIALMRRYAWPGNIRELRNVVERALLLCSGGTITPAHLPVDKMSAHFAARKTAGPVGDGAGPSPETASGAFVPARQTPMPGERAAATDSAARSPLPPPPGPEALLARPVRARAAAPEEEVQKIRHALDLACGNQTEAARLLGVSRRTLINRLEQFGISGPRKKRSQE